MFFSYLKSQYKVIIFFILCVATFAFIFSLYNLEAEAVLYASLLCVFFLIFFFSYGLYRYSKRHKVLMNLSKTIELGLRDLPEPKNLIESDYQALLKGLYLSGLKARAQSDSQRQDTEDYYTLWAHQIKTPISAMRLLLSENGEADKSTLQSELFKTEQYVEMVLQYVRISSDSDDLVLKRYSLDDIIKACLRKYARLFSLKKLEFFFEESGLIVLTDEKWLSFVIEQLFSNSLKYTNSGKISIFSRDGCLFIEDTGIGIRPEDLPRVCEKGYTGNNGRIDKRATGIGLFLCKKILVKLGHRLEIYSVVGKGTRVKIDLRREEIAHE